MPVESNNEKLIAVIGDEDTVTGLLLVGIGDISEKNGSNYYVVDKNTKVKEIEETFKSFVKRGDIGIIVINQCIADMIRHILNDYKETIPTVIEIPSKDKPFDATRDNVIRRVAKMLGTEDI
ncbi:V-type proton ATPase subunit f-like protein [Blastocystis sp. subtype 4]|uniref:V-type proton ATPase subunit f-like protein n=1 Tax=Blastocystis sp. subtype 4 TaxID=944170 RepID=UPI00071131A2|nr:V-type proton ATPase subunit f-like protein [Blastocystis sp. subtype 4]KNB42443.1 V-type proton ATPase subunit f-like protein [Blastocystis sp. subtype 4]|eukprot:XP_014525886.1 V-type proton ATPase subunit f-like protein [Blastocystis sp. subtype 4]